MWVLLSRSTFLNSSANTVDNAWWGPPIEDKQSKNVWYLSFNSENVSSNDNIALSWSNIWSAVGEFLVDLEIKVLEQSKWANSMIPCSVTAWKSERWYWSDASIFALTANDNQMIINDNLKWYIKNRDFNMLYQPCTLV